MGRLKGVGKSPAEVPFADLKKLGRLEFEFGVIVEGELTERIEREGRNVVLAFRDCTVRLDNEILFRPEWGTYDMACGAKITSGDSIEAPPPCAARGGPPCRSRALEPAGAGNRPGSEAGTPSRNRGTTRPR